MSWFEARFIKALDAAPSGKGGLTCLEEVKEEDFPRYRKVDVFRGGDDKQQLILSELDVDKESTLRSNVDLRSRLLKELC